MLKAKQFWHFHSKTEKFNSMGRSFMLFSLVKSCTGSRKAPSSATRFMSIMHGSLGSHASAQLMVFSMCSLCSTKQTVCLFTWSSRHTPSMAAMRYVILVHAHVCVVRSLHTRSTSRNDYAWFKRTLNIRLTREAFALSAHMSYS